MTQENSPPITQLDDNTLIDGNTLKIAELVSYLWANPKVVLTIEQMRQITGLPRRTFFYRFRKCTGQSPHKYFKLVRLHYVHRDLSNGEGNITRSALNYNFNNLGEFSAYHRQVFGVLPSATVKKNPSKRKSLASQVAWRKLNQRSLSADLKRGFGCQFLDTTV